MTANREHLTRTMSRCSTSSLSTCSSRRGLCSLRDGDPHGASIFSVSDGSDGNLSYNSVSCAQISSEVRLYCVFDETRWSATVAAKRSFSGSVIISKRCTDERSTAWGHHWFRVARVHAHSLLLHMTPFHATGVWDSPHRVFDLCFSVDVSKDVVVSFSGSSGVYF